MDGNYLAGKLRTQCSRRKDWLAHIQCAAATICALGAFLFSGAPTHARKMESVPVTLQDQQNYTEGSYTAYASPWSIFFDKTLRHEVDYLDTISVQPATFPDGTVIRTQWPINHPMAKGVWGYMALGFGNYDGGKPEIHVLSHQVKDIKELNQAFSYKWQYSPNFNLLNEFYLTSKPGDSQSKMIEIGFLLHVPDLAWANSSTVIGSLTDASRQAWSIRRAGNYVMIFPQDGRDILSGRINVLSFLKFLTLRGVITGNEWFNGIAFGMEPIKGAGSTQLTIDHWHVTYH